MISYWNRYLSTELVMQYLFTCLNPVQWLDIIFCTLRDATLRQQMKSCRKHLSNAYGKFQLYKWILWNCKQFVLVWDKNNRQISLDKTELFCTNVFDRKCVLFRTSLFTLQFWSDDLTHQSGIWQNSREYFQSARIFIELQL